MSYVYVAAMAYAMRRLYACKLYNKIRSSLETVNNTWFWIYERRFSSHQLLLAFNKGDAANF